MFRNIAIQCDTFCGHMFKNKAGSQRVLQRLTHCYQAPVMVEQQMMGCVNLVSHEALGLLMLNVLGRRHRGFWFGDGR